MTKRPILCLFMVCAFTIVTVKPFTQLSAAELWNSSEPRGERSKKSLYNKRYKDDSSPTLYNRQNSGRTYSSAGLNRDIRAYRRIKIARETRESRLWKFMSPSAIISRQVDTDHALQYEYNSRKRLRNNMVRAAKSREAYRLAGEKRHKAAVEKFQEKKRLERRAAWKKKHDALRWGDDYQRSNRKYKSVRKKPKTGLKKPKRLFNDPND